MQIIGALYGSIAFIWFVRKLPRCEFVEEIGRDSLVVLCIHALDIKISADIVTNVFPNSLSDNFLIAFFGKITFVLLGYSIYKIIKSSIRIKTV